MRNRVSVVRCGEAPRHRDVQLSSSPSSSLLAWLANVSSVTADSRPRCRRVWHSAEVLAQAGRQAGRQASRASSRPRFLPSFLRHSRTTYSPRSPSHATTPPPSSAPAGRGGGRAAARSPDTLTKGQARTIVSNSLTSAGECATAGSLRVPFFFSFPSCSTCSATRSNEYTFRL